MRATNFNFYHARNMFRYSPSPTNQRLIIMMHPHTDIRFISDEIGLGVFATKFIPKGTLIWTMCAFDRHFTPAEVAALPATHQKLMQHYAYEDVFGSLVLCWDGGRYVNHSCKPVMLPVDSGLEVCIRDVAPGEEITCDYSEINLVSPLNCRCGLPECRGKISKQDTEKLWPLWDQQVRDALQHSTRVEQPLLPYSLDPGLFTRHINNIEGVPSLQNFYGSP